jgi:hypothetical protein
MSVLIFDLHVLFEDESCELSNATREVLNTLRQSKAVVTVDYSARNVERMKVLFKEVWFRSIAIANSVEWKKDFIKDLAWNIGRRNGHDVFVVAHHDQPDIRFAKELGFKTIGIMKGSSRDAISLDEKVKPDFDIWSLKLIPGIISSYKPNLVLSQG